jgi:hypothetical protein
MSAPFKNLIREEYMKANDPRSARIGAIVSFASLLLTPALSIIGSTATLLIPSTAVAVTKPCYETDYWGNQWPCLQGVQVVKTNFASFPTPHAGVPVDLYIVGGSALQGPTAFLIKNATTNVILCGTDASSYPTPIWHCSATFAKSGTFLVAATYNGGYRAYAHLPTPIYVTVLP